MTKVNSKICTDCRKRKVLDYFFIAPGGLLGRRSECKQCTMERRMKNNLKKRRITARVRFATATMTPTNAA